MIFLCFVCENARSKMRSLSIKEKERVKVNWGLLLEAQSYQTQFLYQQCLHTSTMPLFILILAKILSTCHVVICCGCFTIVKFGKQFFKPYRKFNVNGTNGNADAWRFDFKYNNLYNCLSLIF